MTPDTPLFVGQAGRARSRGGPARGSAADKNACAKETRGPAGFPALRHTPSLSVRRVHLTQTYALAGRQAPCRYKGGPLGRAAAHLHGGRSQTRARRLQASSQASPPYIHFPPSLGPARTADSVPGCVPMESESQVRLWGRDGPKALGGPRGLGPTHEKSSGRVPGRGSRRLGRTASFGASPISPKLSGARQPRVGPSICWACPSLCRTMRQRPSSLHHSISLSRSCSTLSEVLNSPLSLDAKS